VRGLSPKERVVRIAKSARRALGGGELA
jgi:hypothetical protein